MIHSLVCYKVLWGEQWDRLLDLEHFHLCLDRECNKVNNSGSSKVIHTGSSQGNSRVRNEEDSTLHSHDQDLDTR